MSIIHDALKKAEKTIDSNSKEEVSPYSEEKKIKSNPKVYLLYFLVICLGLFIGNIFFGLLTNTKKPSAKHLPPAPVQKAPEKNLPEPSPVIPPAPEAKTHPKGNFVLSGVFFSQEEGFALINNRIVKVGDEIRGAVVKEIKLNEVELEVEGNRVRLSSQQK